MSSEKDPAGFRVLRLQATNVKRLRAVDITPKPDAPLIIVGGNNGEGKTSALDSILFGLGGKDVVCPDPIRHGQKKASVRVDLGDYIATRRFTPTGQTLELKTKEGLNVPSPQGFLDRLASVLNFDPLAFSRMKAGDRFTTLSGLVTLSVDLDAMAVKRKSLFDSRTDLNRRHRDFEGELRQTVEPDAGLPTVKIDVGALIEKKNALITQHQNNEDARRELRMVAGSIANERVEILELETELTRKRERLAYLEAALLRMQPGVDALVDADTTAIDAQIAEASNLNTQIDRATQYRERAAKLGTMAQEIEKLSDQIGNLDDEKENALAAAEFPIPGLSFADGDVSYNNVLFEQLSSAEQLRVSLAMAMAMNPKLRVILIKDGSLLDETSLSIIREMAQERGYQIWLEVVGNRSDATVIIEDGAVVGAEEAVAE